MRACDAWGDDEPAREAMRAQCLEVPFHLRGELLAHFAATYPATGGMGAQLSGAFKPRTVPMPNFSRGQISLGRVQGIRPDLERKHQ